MECKISYGIAIVRNNKEKNNVVEILAIKKRYSYAYSDFIMGRYKKHNLDYVKNLFDKMSFSEKLDIISMRFDMMWYRIWMSNPEKMYNIVDIYNDKLNNLSKNPISVRKSHMNMYNMYYEKKIKFEKNFLNDNGKKLINIIKQSKDSEILWEIPKGRKNGHETNIDCAVRECTEETSINSSKYRILYDVSPVIDSFIDDNVLYKTVYYIAVLRNPDEPFVPFVNFRNFDQITEIENIKWISLNEVKFLNLAEPIHNRLINLYKQIIIKYKSNKKVKKTNLQKR
jgi:8-oxo-dGTP pyrophosphatase MutT (NUDIX family)